MRKGRLQRVHPVLLSALIATVSATVGGCCINTCALKPDAEGVTAAQASALIEDNRGNEDFVILDVRTAAEYNSGHIEGAINIDVWSDTFEDDIAALDRSKTYLVYCLAGSRSATAADTMKRACFSDLYDLTGGINAWTAAGYDVTAPV